MLLDRSFFSAGDSDGSLYPGINKNHFSSVLFQPVRDLGSGNKEKERVKQTQYVRSSSTPLLDEPPNVNSDWGLRR